MIIEKEFYIRGELVVGLLERSFNGLAPEYIRFEAVDKYKHKFDTLFTHQWFEREDSYYIPSSLGDIIFKKEKNYKVKYLYKSSNLLLQAFGNSNSLLSIRISEGEMLDHFFQYTGRIELPSFIKTID